MEPLRSVQPPHFERRLQPQQRCNLRSRPPGDHYHVRASLLLDTQEQFPYTHPRTGLKAVQTKRRKCAVVVQEQQRGSRARKSTKEILQLLCCCFPQPSLAFYANFSSATSAAVSTDMGAFHCTDPPASAG